MSSIRSLHVSNRSRGRVPPVQPYTPRMFFIRRSPRDNNNADAVRAYVRREVPREIVDALVFPEIRKQQDSWELTTFDVETQEMREIP
jgi:hypothetical protein